MDDRTAQRGLPLLHGYQARVFLALAQGIRTCPGETFTVLFPRQAGKNEVAAALVAWLLAAHARRGGEVVVCAPTAVPQVQISLLRVRRALEAAAHLRPAGVRLHLAGNRVALGRAAATFLSASPEANVAGHTASLALIADEAQEIDAEWFDRQFRPMAASTGAPTVLFGTPWNGETLLDRTVARNRLADAARPGIPYRDHLPRHHEVPWTVVAAANPAYGRYVRAERARLGAHHPLFRTQYGLETVAAAGRLLTAEDLARLEGAHARRTAPAAGERYVAGLDLAGDRPGADTSVLTVARVGAGGAIEVVSHQAWQGAAYDALQDEVIAALRGWGVARVCIDGSGLGGSIAAALERDLGDRAERLTFTAGLKSALGYGLMAAVRRGAVRLYRDGHGPEARACRAELRACTARYDGPTALRWGAPPGAHDDYVVSLALCIRAAEALGPARVAVGRRSGR